MKRKDILEGYGKSFSYHGHLRDREDDEQHAMDREKRDFKRAELQHELGHESNNIQVVINGKPWKVFPGKGRADSWEERQNLQKMKAWAERKSAETGKKWSVHLTGASPTIKEVGPGTDVVSQQKVKSINPDGSAELQDPTGKITKVKQTDLQPDPKDPTGQKLQATVSAPENKLKPGAEVNVTTKATTTSEELGYDQVSGKSAAYILRKLDQGVPLSNLMDDFPELSRMIDIIAGENGLHPDDDFEKIEDLLMNDLEDLADQYDRESNDSEDSYYESKELADIKKLSGL